MKAFTDIAIRNIKPTDKRQEIPDPQQRLLYLIVQPSGRRSFALRYWFADKPWKLTLEGGVTLAAARKLAGDAAYDLDRGINPRDARLAAKRKTAEAIATTLTVICEEHLAANASLRSIWHREYNLRKYVLPVLGERPIASIRRGEVTKLLDQIETSAGRRTAGSVFQAIRVVFNWHAVRDENFSSPLVRGMRTNKAARRQRLLSDDELRKVWLAADEAGIFGILVKALLLTGARKSELSHLPWSEIDGDRWTLPAERNKTGVALMRPLTKQMLDLFHSVPIHRNGNDYVFTHTGRSPVSTGGLIGAKRRFLKLSGTSGWTIHDLRRTARTRLSEAGVKADVAELCLGHVVGGVRGIYDLHEYLDEKRDAYERLGALIERIVSPGANVVELKPRHRG